MSEYRTVCKRCGEQAGRLSWNEDKNGAAHLKVECAACGQWTAWAPQNRQTLALAPRHPFAEAYCKEPLLDWRREFVAFDTETTGLDGHARILEFGAAHVLGGKLVRAYHTMIKPDGFDPNDETTRKALEVNKITLEQIECAPAFLDVLPRICETLSCPIWVAHNLEFDLRMLRQERARLKGQPAASATVPRPALKLCTMLLDVSLGPSAKGRSLAVVAERWGAPVGGPVEWKPISAPFTQEDRCEMHNAWSDAATAAAILMRMLPKLPARCSDMTDLMREGERRWTKIVEARKRIDRERASDSES